jgi:hypothetical protein
VLAGGAVLRVLKKYFIGAIMGLGGQFFQNPFIWADFSLFAIHLFWEVYTFIVLTPDA